MPLDLGSANDRNRRAKPSSVFIAAAPLPPKLLDSLAPPVAVDAPKPKVVAEYP